MTGPRSVVVVGASLAGLSSARALRTLGFDGPLTLVGDEPHPPYDRPPLSKEFLAGRADRGDIRLGVPEDDQLELRQVLGVAAVGLDRGEGAVLLADGERLPADGVVLATGAAPRDLPLPGPRRGVHVLRTVDDAEGLRAQLQPGARLVVVGGGFVGTEVATTAANVGVDVTVVEAGPVPLVRQLGPEVAAAIAARYACAGITLRCGHTPVRLLGHDRVEGLGFDDATVLPADIVLISVGATPRTGWLADSGLRLEDGVRCDATGATGLPGVVAVGDCAHWAGPQDGVAGHRHEHWTSAVEQAGIAAARLLGATPARRTSPPYVWSHMLGVRIQVGGSLAGAELHVVEGADPRLAETWCAPAPRGAAVAVREGTVVGALAVDAPRPFGRWRRRIGSAFDPDGPRSSQHVAMEAT